MNFSKLIKDEEGNSLITLTLASVPFMFIFAMILSFGQAMYGVQVAANASAAGARAAAISDNASAARVAANKIASEYANSAGMGITFQSDDLSYSSWKRKGELEYTVTVNVKTAMPMNLNGKEGIKSNYSPTRSCPAIIEGE